MYILMYLEEDFGVFGVQERKDGYKGVDEVWNIVRIGLCRIRSSDDLRVEELLEGSMKPFIQVMEIKMVKGAWSVIFRSALLCQDEW